MRAAALTVIGCTFLTIGCEKRPADDQALTTSIQAKLYADPVTKPANVNVAVKNSAVTLSGDVPTSDVALEAMKVASGTPGVGKVTDNITVNGAPDKMAPNATASAPPVASATPPPQTAPPPMSPPPGQPPSAAPSTPPPPAEIAVTIPAGERITVRTIDRINSAQNTPGQVFRASLDAPLVSHDRVIVPAGAPASILLANAESAGRIQGRSELELRLSRIEYRGRSYPVHTTTVEETGKARGKQTAVRTGVGAAAGAIIGALAGGGKGAAIGSAAGGGAGFGYDVFTHGQQVKVPPETLLTFRLEGPLTIEKRP